VAARIIECLSAVVFVFRDVSTENGRQRLTELRYGPAVGAFDRGREHAVRSYSPGIASRDDRCPDSRQHRTRRLDLLLCLVVYLVQLRVERTPQPDNLFLALG